MIRNFTNSIVTIIILCSIGSSTLLNTEKNYSNHLELFIHQDIINNFLHSIGEIKGKGKMTIIGYNWTVSNTNIAINLNGLRKTLKKAESLKELIKFYSNSPFKKLKDGSSSI